MAMPRVVQFDCHVFANVPYRLQLALHALCAGFRSDIFGSVP